MVKRLLIATLVVFGLQTLLFACSSIVRGDMLWRVRFDEYLGLSAGDVRSGWLWQIATYMFLHSTSIWHILFNMLVLWMFGREVEDWIGPHRFLALYLSGGVFGGLCWLAANWQGGGPLLGASAAVYAVCIAFATLVPERYITILIFFVLPVTLKAKWWAWFTVGIISYMSLVEANGHVAHLAHLGGVVVGYVFIKWLGYGVPSWPVTMLQRVMQPFQRLKERKPKSDDLPPAEFISQEVDPILDKIAREGIHSLTARERKILEAARGKIERRTRD